MSCTANKSAVCIKVSFAVSQTQQMVVLSLEKYENNVRHFTNSQSISLCYKRLWLKTISLPIDYHVTTKEKYVTSNELSLIPSFTPSHHIYHNTLVSLYYFTCNFSQRMIQSVVNSSLKYKKKSQLVETEHLHARHRTQSHVYRDFTHVVIWYWGSFI